MNCKDSECFLHNTLLTTILSKRIMASPSQSPPRSSAPRRSLCLVSGSATAATVPRRTRLVPHCVHRSTNAARAAYPNPSGIVEVLHIVFVPSAAQAKAAAIRRYGRSMGVFPNANEAPLSLLKKPALRALTTTFRSDGQTIAP